MGRRLGYVGGSAVVFNLDSLGLNIEMEAHGSEFVPCLVDLEVW